MMRLALTTPFMFERLGSFVRRTTRDASPDDVLARRVASGDATALGQLYDSHHAAVRAFARRLLGSEAEAEDVVQDVFVDAPRALTSFEGRSSVRTFLLSVAVNHVRHRKRAISRRLALVERLDDEPIVAGGEEPDTVLERRELARALEQMLDTLPMEQRIAVVLCLVEERTSGEAAEIAGVPEATMRTRLFHARRKLRELIARRGDHPALEGAREKVSR